MPLKTREWSRIAAYCFASSCLAVGACSSSPSTGAGPATPGGGGAAGMSGVASGAGSSGAAGANGGGANGGGANGGGGGTTSGMAEGGEAGSPCAAEPPLRPSGVTINITPPATLASGLATAAPGDRIVLHAGAYTSEQLSKLSFASHVFIEAAAGETVTLPGAHFTSSDHIVIDGLHFSDTLELDGSSNFVLRNVLLDAGASDNASLQLQGQGAAGACHDVQVEDSVIQGGGRTIFVLGKFAPSVQWNHDLSFVRNKITCGTHNCFQISGGRDLLIENNEIIGTGTSGVLTAGATRVQLLRNRMRGMKGSATQIATPGMEWDNYAGVENMISSEISIANNIMSGWDQGVLLDAATNVAIVYNTVADGTGIHFDHRTPHDQQNTVILNGNGDIRIWNNIFPSISIAGGEVAPSFESDNLVWMGGGGGDQLITADPAFDTATDYALSAGSPAVGVALVNAETPLVDFENRPRGSKPDLGARQVGAPPPACGP